MLDYGTILLRKRSGYFASLKNFFTRGPFDKVCVYLHNERVLIEDKNMLVLERYNELYGEWVELSLHTFISSTDFNMALLWATSFVERTFLPGHFLSSFLGRCGLRISPENCNTPNALARFFLLIDKDGKLV